MKRKFKFGVNQVAFVAMCATICVCALMTVNCKLKTNQFIAQYTEKYISLQEELTQLKSETSSAAASVDNLTYHTDAIYDTLKASIESGSTIVKDPTDTSIDTKPSSVDTKVETDNAESITESKVESEANPNPDTQIASSSEPVSNTETTEINHDNIGMTLAINSSDLTKPSNLSADQFNTIIESALTKYGYDYSSSALYNIGESLYNMEQTYGINGLFALSIASEESEYGFSSLAQNKNNPFGISGGSGYRGFDSIDEAIQYFGNLISQYYVGCERTSISSIGDKYCPGSSSWVSDTSWFFRMYGEIASNI